MTKVSKKVLERELVPTIINSEHKVLVDQDTGEYLHVDTVTKRVGQRHFWKVYLMDFLAVLGVFDSKQVDVFVYIVGNTPPSTNTFIGTYKKISKDVGVSEPTIAKIMKKLQENGFIKKVQNGVWFVNPDILMKGSDAKRQILLNYHLDDSVPENVQEVVLERNHDESLEELDFIEDKWDKIETTLPIED